MRISAAVVPIGYILLQRMRFVGQRGQATASHGAAPRLRVFETSPQGGKVGRPPTCLYQVEQVKAHVGLAKASYSHFVWYGYALEDYVALTPEEYLLSSQRAVPRLIFDLLPQRDPTACSHQVDAHVGFAKASHFYSARFGYILEDCRELQPIRCWISARAMLSAQDRCATRPTLT